MNDEENKPAQQAGSNNGSDANPIHEEVLSVSERYFGLVIDDRAPMFNSGMRE